MVVMMAIYFLFIATSLLEEEKSEPEKRTSYKFPVKLGNI